MKPSNIGNTASIKEGWRKTNRRHSALFLYSILFIVYGANVGAEIPLSQYNELEPDQQSRVLGAVISAYYNHYSNSSESAETAACMENLYLPVIEGAGPHLINLILHELDIASQNSNRNFNVENIVQGVIERECS